MPPGGYRRTEETSVGTLIGVMMIMTMIIIMFFVIFFAIVPLVLTIANIPGNQAVCIVDENDALPLLLLHQADKVANVANNVCLDIVAGPSSEKLGNATSP